MEELPYAIFIFSLLSCASFHLSCASPASFTRRHLSQAPVTDPAPGGLPFFPAYGSPSPPSPPPPAPKDLTFPANISALVLPSSPKQHTASRTLLLPVISALVAVSAVIILALFLYGRWRGQTRHESKNLAPEANPSEQAPPCPPPRNTTEKSELSVTSGSSFVKPESPEISPLPPLPARSFLQEEEDDDDFYSPLASLAGKEQRKNPYSNFSCSPSSTSDFPAMISPERQVRNNKRVFSLRNPNIGFPRVSSASTSPERGTIKTPDAYARSSMYSSVSTTPERFFRKVLETSPPRWNDLSRNVKSLLLSSTSASPARETELVSDEQSKSASVHPPPRRPPPPMPEPPALVPPSESFMAQKPGKKLSFSELPQSCREATTERPKTKLKPLPFRPSSCRKNTWDSTKFNSSYAKPKQRSLSCDLPMLNQECRVLNLRKCHSIASLLTTLDLTTNGLLQALHDGHYEALGAELLESLSRIAPSEEEERKLKSYSDVKLAPSERFLKELLNVPFVFKRVDALLSVATFDSKIEHWKQSFGVIEAACEELRNTKTLLKLLEAVLERGTKDYKLEALLELVGRTNILHSVVQNITESEGIKGFQDVGNLSSVLDGVKKAAEMDYGVVRSQVFKIYQGVQKVSEVLLLLNGENEEQQWWAFRESMTRFLETAVEEIKKIETVQGSVISAVKEITEYFHGDSSAKEEAQVLRVFVVVSDFLCILDDVCKEMDASKEESTLA